MVTSRRKSLLVVLLILLLLPLVVGGVGTVELSIWVVLLVAWLAAFAFWGGRRHATEPSR